MQFAVSQIMIVMLLIHSALGCCLHHAHVCNVNCGDASTAIATVCPCESHQHEEHKKQQDDASSEGEHHHDDCDGDHCTFVRSDRSSEECGNRLAVATFLFWDASLQEGDRVCARFSQAIDRSTSDSRPPVRSHLLLSILLI
jgi:hypothetical protein